MKDRKRFKGVIDTTLRDGQQSPLLFDTYSYRFTREDKLTIIRGLAEIGVTMIEFFSPIVSMPERDDFRVIRDYVRKNYPRVRLLAHCRVHPDDIGMALEEGFDGLNLYIGTSPHARQSSHGYSLEEIEKRAADIVGSLRSNHPSLYIRFSAEDCFRTPLADIYKLYDALAESVDTLGMPDTVGIATPEMVRERTQKIAKRYPDKEIECHFHNDRGYALVNAVTAVYSGASYINTSIWGMAERSGIPSLTGLLFNLYQEDRSLCKDYNLELCYPLNVLMGSILKYHVPYNEPVSVTNRTHTAGVHQKAVLKDSVVYEAMNLEKFGVSKNQLLLGPLSGWNLVYYFLREFKNYDITRKKAREITEEFKRQTYRINKTTSPESILLEVADQANLKKLPVQKQALKRRVENI